MITVLKVSQVMKPKKLVTAKSGVSVVFIKQPSFLCLDSYMRGLC